MSFILKIKVCNKGFETADMNTEDIISFFNNQAPFWDRDSVRNEEVIKKILDLGEVKSNKDVLDVACGTGFLIPDYLKIGVASVTGVDISPKMLEIAKNKFPFCTFICADAQSYAFKSNYDVIMIHNAFPHFENPLKLFSNLQSALNSGGRLTVAHSLSRKALNSLHSSKASKVSNELIKAQELSKLMENYLFVDTVISDDKMYLVSGVKK